MGYYDPGSGLTYDTKKAFAARAGGHAEADVGDPKKLKVPTTQLDRLGIAAKGKTPKELGAQVVAAVNALPTKAPRAAVVPKPSPEDDLYEQVYPSSQTRAASTFTAEEDAIYVACFPESDATPAALSDDDALYLELFPEG